MHIKLAVRPEIITAEGCNMFEAAALPVDAMSTVNMGKVLFKRSFISFTVPTHMDTVPANELVRIPNEMRNNSPEAYAEILPENNPEDNLSSTTQSRASPRISRAEVACACIADTKLPVRMSIRLDIESVCLPLIML